MIFDQVLWIMIIHVVCMIDYLIIKEKAQCVHDSCLRFAWSVSVIDKSMLHVLWKVLACGWLFKFS